VASVDELYTTATAQFVCNRIETLRILGIKALFEDVQTGALTFPLVDRERIQKYISLQKQEAEDPDAVFDMGAMSPEELKAKIDRANYEIVQNSFALIEDVFLPD